MWEQTLDDSHSTVADALNGGKSPFQVNQKLMHDIQVLVSRLVAKAPQLIDEQRLGCMYVASSMAKKLSTALKVDRGIIAAWVLAFNRIWGKHGGLKHGKT